MDGGEGKHSVFTGHLLQALEKGEGDLNGDGWITFHEISGYLVPAASNKYQTPAQFTFPGHAGGEFVFQALGGGSPSLAKTTPSLGGLRGPESSNGLRFDGVYQKKLLLLIHKRMVFLRFYEDGTVLKGICEACDEQGELELDSGTTSIKYWLTKENVSWSTRFREEGPLLHIGNYQRDGNQLKFTTEFPGTSLFGGENLFGGKNMIYLNRDYEILQYSGFIEKNKIRFSVRAAPMASGLTLGDEKLETYVFIPWSDFQ